MMIKLIEKMKLLIILSTEDMNDMNISLSELFLGSPTIAETITCLLEKGREEVDFDYPKSKMHIEIYPTDTGGAAVYFTAVPSYKLTEGGVGSVCEPAVFAFEDIDDVINASVMLFKQHCHRIFKSSIYKYEENYRLIIYPIDCAEGVAVEFLKEFAPLLGQNEVIVSQTKEHGTAVVIDNAIDKIAYYLS